MLKYRRSSQQILQFYQDLTLPIAPRPMRRLDPAAAGTHHLARDRSGLVARSTNQNEGDLSCHLESTWAVI